jgi:hypothetical protein
VAQPAAPHRHEAAQPVFAVLVLHEDLPRRRRLLPTALALAAAAAEEARVALEQLKPPAAPPARVIELVGAAKQLDDPVEVRIARRGQRHQTRHHAALAQEAPLCRAAALASGTARGQWHDGRSSLRLPPCLQAVVLAEPRAVGVGAAP